jgi:lysozyme
MRLAPALLTVSACAIAAIAVYEGYRGRAYVDAAGVHTLGFGSTRRADGSPVAPGDTITPERAVVRLAEEVTRIERELARCIGDVPLAQHEWDAIVSWAYNVGSAAACRSTLVARLRQQPPDYAGACRELLRWTRAGGRELPGLVKRRQEEYRRCIREAR